MFSLIYSQAKRLIMNGEFSINRPENYTLYALLVMTESTAEIEIDALTLNDIRTLDEMDGANYARQLLVSVENTPAYEPTVFSQMERGSRSIKGVLVYMQRESEEIPIIYIGAVTSPYRSEFFDFTVEWSEEGIIHLSLLGNDSGTGVPSEQGFEIDYSKIDGFRFTDEKGLPVNPFDEIEKRMRELGIEK